MGRLRPPHLLGDRRHGGCAARIRLSSICPPRSSGIGPCRMVSPARAIGTTVGHRDCERTRRQPDDRQPPARRFGRRDWHAERRRCAATGQALHFDVASAGGSNTMQSSRRQHRPCDGRLARRGPKFAIAFRSPTMTASGDSGATNAGDRPSHGIGERHHVQSAMEQRRWRSATCWPKCSAITSWS